jgi:hypothetical protein
VLGKMWTDAQAEPNFGGATYSALSFNTAAHADRFAASYSASTPVTTNSATNLNI